MFFFGNVGISWLVPVAKNDPMGWIHVLLGDHLIGFELGLVAQHIPTLPPPKKKAKKKTGKQEESEQKKETKHGPTQLPPGTRASGSSVPGPLRNRLAAQGAPSARPAGPRGAPRARPSQLAGGDRLPPFGGQRKPWSRGMVKPLLLTLKAQLKFKKAETPPSLTPPLETCYSTAIGVL